MNFRLIPLVLFLVIVNYANAQPTERAYTHADTLRGSITPERAWWDVLRYDLTVKPNYTTKTTQGNNIITYNVTSDKNPGSLQIDLQVPMTIDSIRLDDKQSLTFTREGNAWHVKTPQQNVNTRHQLKIFFSGKPHEAVNAPWDGGWTFTKDSLGRPWMTVTCQGLGASIWYPCKDHQSDEPNEGASLTMIVPDSLMAVSNGRLQSTTKNGDGTTSYKWAVVNPISTYCLIPYIGKYVNFTEVYKGEKGNLDLSYWALDYHKKKAQGYMPVWVHKMLAALEHWFGPYPFYEDSYKLIETSYYGMEHQSAVSYGNFFKMGYHGTDESGTGWGMKFDFIIIHESGHEWFGNNITSKDLADMWIHESFTNYSETVFTDFTYGTAAGNEYNFGTRKKIRNQRVIIPQYGVNGHGSGDMYYKGGNMIHSIRHSMNDDEKFRQVLRGLNKEFYHQTVTARQVQDYINKAAGFNYDKVFDQYLRTIQVPTFEYAFTPDSSKVSFRYSNCVKGFNLPLALTRDKVSVKLFPTDEWKEVRVKANQIPLISTEAIEKMYYVKATPVLRNP